MTNRSFVQWMHLGVPQGILGAVLGVVFTSLLQARGYLPQGAIVLVLGVIAHGLILWSINYVLMRSSDRFVRSVYAPSGDTTAYVPTFSHIEALEIRGDLVGAEQAWEEACRENPGNALVLVKAADFHLRLLKQPAAALERFRRVRDLAGASPDLVRYASQKIIDLHLGPLADEGRALVELRRMIDRFPGTREADDARAVLARLKAERAAGG